MDKNCKFWSFCALIGAPSVAHLRTRKSLVQCCLLPWAVLSLTMPCRRDIRGKIHRWTTCNLTCLPQTSPNSGCPDVSYRAMQMIPHTHIYAIPNKICFHFSTWKRSNRMGISISMSMMVPGITALIAQKSSEIAEVTVIDCIGTSNIVFLTATPRTSAILTTNHL